MPTEMAKAKMAMRTEKTRAGMIPTEKKNITIETAKLATSVTKEARTVKPKYAPKLILMPALIKLFFNLPNAGSRLFGNNSDKFNRKASSRLRVSYNLLQKRIRILIVAPYGV